MLLLLLLSFSARAHAYAPMEAVTLGERWSSEVGGLLEKSGGPLLSPPSVEPQRSSKKTLLALTSQNVWVHTLAMLTSLYASPDDGIDVLVVDECSTDGTRSRLRAAGINFITVNESRGVTHNWNLAYQHFLDNEEYDHLVYANNDVLVPPGAIRRLTDALDNPAHGCDLVAPLSTVRGKGHTGFQEGIEAVFNLGPEAARMANNPLAYARVQAALDAVFLPTTPTGSSSGDGGSGEAAADGSQGGSGVEWPATPLIKRSGEFNGFLFALPRRIAKAAAGPRHLFSTDIGDTNFHQEHDLSMRMNEAGMVRCLHLGSFVYHFKAATIPISDDRLTTASEGGRTACEAFQRRQQELRERREQEEREQEEQQRQEEHQWQEEVQEQQEEQKQGEEVQEQHEQQEEQKQEEEGQEEQKQGDEEGRQEEHQQEEGQEEHQQEEEGQEQQEELKQEDEQKQEQGQFLEDDSIPTDELPE